MSFTHLDHAASHDVSLGVKLYRCPLCHVEKPRRGIVCHVAKAHGMTSSELCVALFHGGVTPTCRCGCGTPLTLQRWTDTNEGFNDFVRGHNGFPDEARREVDASLLSIVTFLYG